MSGLPSPLKSATTMEWGPEATAKVLAVKNIVACSASALLCEAITIRDIALTISLEGTLNLLGRTGSNKPRVRERVGIRGEKASYPSGRKYTPDYEWRTEYVSNVRGFAQHERPPAAPNCRKRNGRDQSFVPGHSTSHSCPDRSTGPGKSRVSAPSQSEKARMAGTALLRQ